MLAQCFYKQSVLLCVIASWQYVVREIRAVESSNDRSRISESELTADVFADFRRCSRGKRDCRRRAELLARLGYAQVAWTEVMSPLTYTVGLIHREKTDTDVTQSGCDVSKIESFRREIEKAHFTAGGTSESILNLCRLERAVDECSRQISRLECIHLIFHQRDERRHDDCQTGKHQRWNLVTH